MRGGLYDIFPLKLVKYHNQEMKLHGGIYSYCIRDMNVVLFDPNRKMPYTIVPILRGHRT